ncbi:transposase [Kitasatospora sp. NPDC051914]|uniref:transposase n=1 Tax=Kitasatospora sp. NPDC051914 TaxID=3154945 RepID=UPI00341E2BB2
MVVEGSGADPEELGDRGDRVVGVGEHVAGGPDDLGCGDGGPALLLAVPGIETRAAQVVLAEIGPDASRFPTAADLASWAGVCPGNHQSGTRRGSGTTRHGDPWLKAALGQAAVSASRTKDTYLAARYRRLVARRGKERALVALEHSILIAVWHMFTRDAEYTDFGGHYFIERTGRARQTRHLVSQLNQLGYHVTLQAEGAV